MEVAEEPIKVGVGLLIIKVQIKNLRTLCVSDLMTYAPRHYVDVGFVADWAGGNRRYWSPKSVSPGSG
jgi:hypothetical protein